MRKLKRLYSGEKIKNKLINDIIDKVNVISNIKGRNGVTTTVTNQGIMLRGSGISAIGALVRKAYVKTTPDAVNTVDCYLDIDATGDEITVSCSDFIVGGTALNAVIPRLINGIKIYVAKFGDTWECVGVPFQTIDSDELQVDGNELKTKIDICPLG